MYEVLEAVANTYKYIPFPDGHDFKLLTLYGYNK